ncbi:HTH_Tnp_Tc3_2 domain-containing protein [Trichonephila clavipes]|nr:HTH_Tnp_Tc3_2 domain-containing protein [Trichonephila clavipes]
MPQCRIRAYYEQLSEFERGRIIRLKEAGWTNRRIARHMGRKMRPLEDAAVTAPNSLLATIRRATRTRVSTMTIPTWLIERNLLVYQPLRRLPFTPVHCRAGLQLCLDRSRLNHVDWGRIVFSDESRFQLCLDDRYLDSVPILLSLLYASQTLNHKLWFGVPFLLTAGLFWVEVTCSTAIRRRHSENCFVAVPIAAP